MSMTRGAKMLMVRNEANRGNQTNREYGRMENEMRYEGGSGGRNEMRYEMRNEGEMRRGGSGVRNEYGDMNYPRYEYGGMNYGESRFRDRRGREHYDNGRFAPMRGETEGEMRGEMRGAYNEMRGEEMRGARNEMGYGEMRGEEMEMRRGSGGRSHYPFGPVPPVYERETEMNRIGFVVPIGRSEVESNYPNNAAYSAMGEMDYKTTEPMKGGASGKTMELTEDMAYEWMHNLHNEDGTKGPHWTMDQTKQVMSQRGIKSDPLETWVVLNALYSDYCGVLKKHGANNMDVYVDMAKVWLDDKDAKEGKVVRYFQYIVK